MFAGNNRDFPHARPLNDGSLTQWQCGDACNQFFDAHRNSRDGRITGAGVVSGDLSKIGDGPLRIFDPHAPAERSEGRVCEFIAFSKAYDRFQELGCDLLGLSVDSLFAHIAWIANIKERFGVEVPFPIVEDPSMAVARAYGMLHPGAHTSATVRATFVIDPEGMIRAIVRYPMNVGRSVDELLRLVMALQTSDKSDVYTPEGWRPGDPVLVPPPLVARNGKGTAPTAGQTDWYFRLEPAHG
jgi:peroxiredoxin (alkyl hydroperoxide reductase subunit C)